MPPLGHRSSWLIASLNDRHGDATLRQVGGRSKPLGAGADDYDGKLVHHISSNRKTSI